MTNKQMLFKMDSKQLAEFLVNTDFCKLFCPEKEIKCSNPSKECIERSIEWLCEEREVKRWEYC